MKFLSKLASVAQKVGQVIGIFGPMIQMTVPSSGAVVGKIIDTSEKLTAVIVSAELSGQALGLPGPDKLKLAAPNIAQVILGSAAIAGRKIANPVLFTQGATKIGDGWADILNSLHEDEATKP